MSPFQLTTANSRVSKKERLELKQCVSQEEPTSLCSAVAEWFTFHTRHSSCLSCLFTGLSAPRLSAFFPAVRTRRRPHCSSPGDGCRHRCGRKPKVIYLCVPPPATRRDVVHPPLVYGFVTLEKKKKRKRPAVFFCPPPPQFRSHERGSSEFISFQHRLPLPLSGRAPTAALVEFTNANHVKLVA